VTAIDQDREADGPRASVVDERIHGGTDRAPGEEDIVDEHDDLVVDGEIERGLVHDGRVADPREVIAIQRDVDGPERDVGVLVRGDRVAQPGREDVAARADADDGEAAEVAVALDDLVGDARDRATHVVGAEQDGTRRNHDELSFPASQDRSLKVVRYGEYMRPIVAIVGASAFAAVVVIAASSPASPPAASAQPTAPSAIVYATADPNVTSRVAPKEADGRVALDDRVDRTRRTVSGLALPIEGVALPTDPALMPNAPRDFRAGWHEGIDFPADRGTPVHAVAAGRIVRIDHDFMDWSPQEEEIALYAAVELGYTPSPTLDRIRGRQVWVDHGNGIVSRYAHLDDVADLQVGASVETGTVVGFVGSTGYPEGGPHLHLEIRLGSSYLGDGLGGQALASAVAAAFN